LREEVKRLNHKCSELEAELTSVETERDSFAATVVEFTKAHKRWKERALTPEKRDRILSALGVGKQSPQYKRVKAVLDQFVNEVKGDG
jgi:hypothetical protein